MRILVLDGNENHAVACVRSLGRAGHRVFVGADASWSKAGWSRAARGQFSYPSPQLEADAFVDRIAAEASREPGTLVLPMTERSTLPLSRERDRLLLAGARLVLPPHEAVLRAFDKAETTRLAASLGLVVPQTWTIDQDADAHAHAADLPYPVVLKPRSSEEPVPGEGMRALRTTGAPVYARTRSEFLSAWAAMSARCRSALVQEFVEGTGVGFFALMRHGDSRAEFAHRRLRDVRPTGSGSALRESVPAVGLLRERGLAMLRALGWHGAAMVEFRVQRDGTPVFLEVNGRFWNSLALAVYAGVDFPALLARLAEHGDVEAPPPYRVGVRSRWLLGDVRHLVDVWRGAPAQFPGTYPDRWATLAATLTPVPGTYHDNFTLRDPLPELGDWIDFIVRRVPYRARHQAGAVGAPRLVRSVRL
jgi:predicted ATP-grasp superfamily ATP-dependent carboligase